MSEQHDKIVAAAIRRLEQLNKKECFDPAHPDSKPTAAQQELFDDFQKIPHQYVVAATQSGKSQGGSRLVSWLLEEVSGKFTRPKEWGNEPLLILVAGRTGKQIEESLLPKITSYLESGSYKEVRIGNIIQRLEHKNGNRIIFQSLENPNVARERIQSYVAHMCWLDEMPPTAAIVDELQRRVQARNGYFLATFTPLVVNDQIRRMVDAASEPYAKKYKFKMFDNPLYASPERQAEILASMATLPEHVRNTRLFGDWSVNDDAVYYFDYAKMVEMPEGYSPISWRHVLSVDPALKSALGLTIWAENPHTHVWYCIEADYIKNIYVPTELVTAVELRASRYNIVRRIADPHEVWYIQTAASMGKNYIGVHKKNERKSELIKQLQEGLGSGRIKLCPNCELFFSELQECRFSDRAEGRIINSSSYHVLDSAQYFVDNIPRPETRKITATSHDQWLYEANTQRIKDEQKAEEQYRRTGRRPKIVNKSRNRGSLWKLF